MHAKLYNILVRRNVTSRWSHSTSFSPAVQPSFWVTRDKFSLLDWSMPKPMTQRRRPFQVSNRTCPSSKNFWCLARTFFVLNCTLKRDYISLGTCPHPCTQAIWIWPRSRQPPRTLSYLPHRSLHLTAAYVLLQALDPSRATFRTTQSRDGAPDDASTETLKHKNQRKFLAFGKDGCGFHTFSYLCKVTHTLQCVQKGCSPRLHRGRKLRQSLHTWY